MLGKNDVIDAQDLINVVMDISLEIEQPTREQPSRYSNEKP